MEKPSRLQNTISKLSSLLVRSKDLYETLISSKDTDPEYFEKIRTCETPGEAKKLGKVLTMKRTDW